MKVFEELRRKSEQREAKEERKRRHSKAILDSVGGGLPAQSAKAIGKEAAVAAIRRQRAENPLHFSHHILACTVLEKGGHGMMRSGWCKRLFVLTNTSVQWFNTEDDVKARYYQTPLGQWRNGIRLDEVTGHM